MSYLGLSDDDVDTIVPALDQLETFVGQGQPSVCLSLNITAKSHPVISLTRSQQTSHIVSVRVVVFLDFPKSEGQFPHPVHAPSHAPGGQVDLGRGGVGPEAVRVEVVAAQILTVVITCDIVNMNLECLLKHQSDQFQNSFIKTLIIPNLKYRITNYDIS